MFSKEEEEDMDLVADLDAKVEIIKENLFSCAMKSEWDEVVRIYSQQPMAHTAKMPLSGETALHIAVSAGKEAVVEQLIQQINEPNRVDVLSIGNQCGNTPLHLAASMGKAHICRFISAIDTRLVAARNRGKETPLFLAVLNGHKDAFLSLRANFPTTEWYEYCRRSDGKTILHCAIDGGYFDLALVIIHRYEDLVNSVDEKGFTPLHILAGKPTAFRSGTHLHFMERLIYQFMYVEKQKRVEDNLNIQQICEEQINLRRYPENYHTFMNFWNMIKRPVSHMIKAKGFEDVEAENRRQEGMDFCHQSGHQRRAFPPNYAMCLELIKFTNKAMLVVLGFGFGMIRKIVDEKEKHSWSLQIMDELLRRAPSHGYNRNGRNPKLSQLSEDEETTKEHKLVSDTNRNEKEGSCSENCPQVKNGRKHTLPFRSSSENTNKNGEAEKKNVIEFGNMETPILIAAKNSVKEMVDSILERYPMAILDRTSEKKNIIEFGNKETPILIAAKNGVKEMVDSILERYPMAILDRNSEKKNVVLLAVENRQPEVYELLLGKNIMKDTIFHVIDKDGNSALHLAAMVRDNEPWHIPGAALQMQWEIKWYKYVKNSMPRHFFIHRNKSNQTPKEIFTHHHCELVRRGGKWLNNTSSSCSVIATLIATVAFATSATIPGSFNDDGGRPNLLNQASFKLFTITSLIALGFSVTAMVMFLAILSSRHQEDDFHENLPQKLLLGLTTLFISISAILVSFCAGHYYLLGDELKCAAFPLYTITCLPISFFALVQFPLYFDVVWTTYTKVPQRRYKVNL